MDEELPLSIDYLSVCDPGDHLADEHMLAFFENGAHPLPQPLVALLEHLPQDVDYYSSAILLDADSVNNFAEFLHYVLEPGRLGSDVAESEVAIFQVIALDAEDQLLILLERLP